MMRALEHASVPLSGMNLIEASAGTGKTHAIGSLYLRLVVEESLLPDSILVVTYTEAASGELRGRIRDRIRDTLHALRDPQCSQQALLEIGSAAVAVGVEEAARRLEGALGSFDTAAVHTIHAFCLRALQDHAFESGSLYDTALGADQHELLQGIVEDFWRQRFFSPESPLSGYIGWKKDVTPESFTRLLSSLRPGPFTCIRPDYPPEEPAAAEARCTEAYRAAAGMWKQERALIVSILNDDAGLSRAAGAYKKEELILLFERMDAYLESGSVFDCFTGFERFTSASLRANMKKKYEAPVHRFFDAAEALLRELDLRLLVLKSELVRYYRSVLPRRKEELNVRLFDDLLTDLYLALEAEGGGRLGEVLRSSYPAALIDEFQDTDPVQYEIFRMIYAGSDLPLFLIGDPKQAIYSFRGADLFAYLKAAASVDGDCRFTLEKNWRSAPLLLEGFNTLFLKGPNPFLYPGIAYRPVSSGGGGPRDPFTHEDDRHPEPLQLWLLDARDAKNGCLTVEAAEEMAAAAVAGEIVRLLGDARAGKARIGDVPLAASDMAVIVRTHLQAAKVHAALRARGVPAVMQSDRSVFLSPVAGEVLLLLEALLHPSSEGRIRSALVTTILGRTGNVIAALSADGEEWIACLRDFAQWNQLWRTQGFMAMTRAFMRKEGVRRRVLAREGGQRTLTDILHCFELLHQHEHTSNAGPEALLAWFSERCLDTTGSEDAYQMRLETDEAAVKIVTVHVSKGLQYPLVFCPYLWKGSTSTKEVAAFHDASGEAVRDFGSPGFPDGMLRAGEEAMAEDLRLFYVALTRAEHRCCFISARVSGGVSALNYLLHAGESVQERVAGAPERLLEAMEASSPLRMEADLRALAEESRGAVGFRLLTQDDLLRAALPAPKDDGSGAIGQNLRRFSGRIDSSWRVSSFTSFSRQGHRPQELPDRDETASGSLPQDTVSTEDAEGIFAFPRGAKAGLFMHEIFEHIDFSAPDPLAIRKLVDTSLQRYGYEPKWSDAVTGMVEGVLQMPLGEGEDPFRLGALQPGSWVSELEFFMPMSLLQTEALQNPLRRHGLMPEGADYRKLADSLEFQPATGMLLGFMDMVFEAGGRFWLLDWKSNHLGNRASDYAQDGMEAAMEEHRYHLQYLFYLSALNRHLTLRVPGYTYRTHFGGVLYVFLRGVDGKGRGTGLYRVRPPAGLIEELTLAIAGEFAS
ncbi:exodeoxyribonuclease V subunit beta [Pelodictyon luteolum]|uniref:RecBCD enzyme subunit RecB n=1 Tax=Chlorobium luteolum (strain DSM 273 / BCRC 81028 / 2530) TaxID=319225 RepID=Q3B472_CHLL3|nr:exodeoxyribonuclease V subunit beta [Pelodictyon luteolum]ABB23859.1 Exodeoxyribonuclease V, beta subunit [Pelodictyon luteolum DSM 273]